MNTDYLPIQVSTPSGPIKGSILESYEDVPIYTFQGIRYGKPPIGELRFKDPEPAEAWTTVFDATSPPTICPSLIMFTKPPIVAPGSSEDCLFLNIYTPKAPDADSKLPVMVWIHGGGFTNGNGNRQSYGPDYLVPKGVILVSINYRLGALGFLSFQNKECPGNFGLKDIKLGLEWVQKNISSFGGDPDNVTIFGESAGGAAVHYLTLSPTTRGLFHKAIAQSGSALNRWAYSKHPLESAFLLAKRLGCDTTDRDEALKFITKASVEDILFQSVGLGHEIEGIWDGDQNLNFAFVPTTEPTNVPNAFLTKTPQQAVADNDAMDIPCIFGVCSAEMLFCVAPSLSTTVANSNVPKYTEPEEYQKMLPKELEIPLGSANMVVAAKKLRDFYFPNGITKNEYIQALSALWFIYGVYQTTKALSDNKKRKSPTYLYRFDSRKTDSILHNLFKITDETGACHGSELEFMFHPMSYGPIICNPIKGGSSNALTKSNIIESWTDFAKTGSPGSSWPVFDTTTYQYASITSELTAESDFLKEEMNLWEDIYDMLSKPKWNVL